MVPSRERRRWAVACLLALLLVAGCGPAAAPPLPSATIPAADATRMPPSAMIPQAPTAGPAADLVTSPLPTPGTDREPLQLVVLHSNDNWGETEPCG